MAIYVNAKSLAKVFMLKNKDKLRLSTVINEIELAEKGLSRNVDFVEVKHGHWIKRGNEKKCSVCDFIYYSNNDDWNGCPNCLAKMDGGKQG